MVHWQRHLILAIFIFFLLVSFILSLEMGFMVDYLQRWSPVVLPSPYAHAIPAIKKVVSLSPRSVGWPSMTECDRVMLWITDHKKGQFLSHVWRRKSRLPCWHGKHVCSRNLEALQPAASTTSVSHCGPCNLRWAWLTPRGAEMSSPLEALPQTAYAQNHVQIK